MTDRKYIEQKLQRQRGMSADALEAQRAALKTAPCWGKCRKCHQVLQGTSKELLGHVCEAS